MMLSNVTMKDYVSQYLKYRSRQFINELI